MAGKDHEIVMQEIIISRILDASRAQSGEAWTKPEHQPQ